MAATLTARSKKTGFSKAALKGMTATREAAKASAVAFRSGRAEEHVYAAHMHKKAIKVNPAQAHLIHMLQAEQHEKIAKDNFYARGGNHTKWSAFVKKFSKKASVDKSQ